MTDEQGEIGRSRPCFYFFNQLILSAQGFGKSSFSDESLTFTRTQDWDTKNFFVSTKKFRKKTIQEPRFLKTSLALPDRPPLYSTKAANDHIHGWLRVSNRTEHFPVCPPYNRFRKSNLPSMLHENKPFPASVVQAGKGFGSLRESP